LTEGDAPPFPGGQGERRQGERRREERDRIRLFEQLVAAEQDERRRLALFLHDGAVQSLSGIALMLDAVGHAIEEGRYEDAQQVLASALERQRQTIQSLRDLSFNLEPVVLRDQGFVPAVRALADRLGIEESVKVEVDVAAGEEFVERARVALYQLIREALNQAVGRRPTTISVSLADLPDGGAELTVEDDGHLERRRGSAEAFEERARPLSGRVDFQRTDAGTTVSVLLPAYAIRG
jgi:two-component system, NarL family, sensor histidine kinase UhpB